LASLLQLPSADSLSSASQTQAIVFFSPIQKEMPRNKADADKPRGRINAYAFFVQTCREQHKKNHPNENVVFSEFSRKCGERWKTMSDKEKKRFQEMAERDKERFDNEMKHYEPVEPQGKGTKRKQMKDPNAPKRPLNAYFMFCNDERASVKAVHSEFTPSEISKELGRRWGEVDAATKQKYESMAQNDKARYEREMSAYKKKPRAGGAQEAEDDDDDEEEDYW